MDISFPIVDFTFFFLDVVDQWRKLGPGRRSNSGRIIGIILSPDKLLAMKRNWEAKYSRTRLAKEIYDVELD